MSRLSLLFSPEQSNSKLESYLAVQVSSHSRRLRITTPEIAVLAVRNIGSERWECVLCVSTIDAPAMLVRRECSSKYEAIAAAMRTLALFLTARQQAGRRSPQRRYFGEVSQ